MAKRTKPATATIPEDKPSAHRIELGLSAVTAARAELERLAVEQRAVDAELARAKRALDAATRAGTASLDARTLTSRMDAARRTRKALVDQRRGLRARLTELGHGMVRDRDPAALVASLDGHQPIAFLPMRIETRYVPSGAPNREPNRLRIRIYPDDIHTIDHEPALTADEQRAGMAYWSARFAHADDEAARNLRDLTSRFGRGRAAWVVRVLTPSNSVPEDAGGDQPAFPPADTIVSLAKSTRAVLLPARFCAIGYGPGRRELFRVWGNPIPDELVLSPDWLATDEPEALLGGDRAWMVDFDAALENGMAIEVTQAQIARPRGAPAFDLARDTLERLVIVGFEWTKAPADSAADLSALLAAHRDSSGLGFAALGTPTNNSETAPAGYSPSAQRVPQAATPGAGPQDQDALQLLSWGFGIDPDTLPADNIDDPHLTDQRTALHMLNALFRGTFGDYLIELWNPGLIDSEALSSSTLYALRRYAASYLRPAGPLPLLRVDKQPYAILPLVGKRFVDPGGASIETAIGKILAVLRPLWELAAAKVPLLTDGDVDKAKQILQTAAWSQTAYYRDKDNRQLCMAPTPFSDAQQSGRVHLVQKVLEAIGITDYWSTHIAVCNDFLPEPPYAPGYLAGVPWVLANDKDPTKEADDTTDFTPANNYLAAIANAAIQIPAEGKALLDANQAGPALLQALLAYSVQKEQGDAVDRFVGASDALQRYHSRAATTMAYVEPMLENEATFIVQTPKELASVTIPSLTGRATLGEHVANSLAAQLKAAPKSKASLAADGLFDAVSAIHPQTRDLGAVKLSLDYLSTRNVGELNIAFRSTLDAFSYRLDAWITARANRRLEQMRAAAPLGIHIGGYAFVENLKADERPDSEGFLLAPSQAQAASAALLRSGFMANHEQGAFDIALDSKRTRRALDLLQGLTRDQPLAALYGYRIERGLRDALLGKLIWPLRLSYPWRPAGAGPSDEPAEAIGARDVVDGVALLAAWEAGPAAVFDRLDKALKVQRAPASSASERAAFKAVIQAALDLADSVSDLLLAEGAHQITQGNPVRAAAAMAVADKQSLPIETQVDRTPRGGASYTQRIAVLCPDPVAGWPDDRRARAEPAVNAWLATMLADPTRYRFVARVHRKSEDGRDVIDADPLVASLDQLALSPLSAVLMADGVAASRAAGSAETGFRGILAAALIARIAEPASVSGLEIAPEGDAPTALGLAHFEALAMTLKAVIDKARFATRKDMVRIDDDFEAVLPAMGEYPGVDVAEIVARADALSDDFDSAADALLAAAGADALLATLAALSDFLPQVAWPAQVFAIDAPGSDPATRDARAADAIVALQTIISAKQAALQAGPTLLDGQATATDAQRVQHAIERIRLLLGKDFPVLPRFVLGPYAVEFNASLADQAALTVADPWRINGWLTQIARVHEGADRFTGALSAHEALCEPVALGDFKLVQFPHRAGQIWAALPEAWIEQEGTPFDPQQVPEELRDYLSTRPGTPYRDIQRVAPDITLALHAPGVEAIAADRRIAAFVCDEWPEFIPDPFQTAGIAFHYDAPGARPPQSILLALPPQLGQTAWSFDDAVDVINEAFDLAKLRGVRPRDLGAGLGAVLPGNYLPHGYTDDLPSVRMLELSREARKRVATFVNSEHGALTLGKV